MPYRVAVVDDNAGLLHVMHSVLGQFGYEVAKVRNPRSVARQLHHLRPDAVVLDVNLGHPDSGWDVLAQVRADPVLESTPVIMYSADIASLRERQVTLDRFRCAALEKPFELQDLLKLLRDALPQSAITH